MYTTTDSHPLVGRGQWSSAVCSKFFLHVFMYFETFNTNNGFSSVTLLVYELSCVLS